MDKLSFLRESLHVDTETLHQALQNKETAKELCFYGFERSEQYFLERFGKRLGTYGPLSYVKSFSSKGQSDALHVFHLTHLATDEEEILTFLSESEMFTLPEQVKERVGHVYVKTVEDGIGLFYRNSESSINALPILEVFKEIQEVITHFGKYLATHYGHRFEDVSKPSLPNLLYISEEDAPPMTEAYLSGESFHELLDELFDEVAKGKITEQTLYYSSGLNHFAIYLPSQIADSIKK